MNTPQELKQLEEMEHNGEIDTVKVNKEMKEPTLTPKRKPTDKTGSFRGEKGNSLFISNSASVCAELKKYGAEGVEYVNGYPDFSPFCTQHTPWGTFVFSASIDHMNASRHNFKVDGFIVKGNYEQAEEAFCRIINNSKSGDSITRKEFRQWYQSNKLSIHECPDGYNVQLVPSLIHDACRHDGAIKNKKFEFAMGDIELFDGRD